MVTPAPRANTSRANTLRIDKWLWHARKVKTRSKATRLVQDGKIRVNREKITKASHAVRPGDVITASIGAHILILEVLEPGARRGPASEAAALYKDLSPAQPRRERASEARPEPPRREKGSGRPTKRERRQTDRLRHRALYENSTSQD